MKTLSLFLFMGLAIVGIAAESTPKTKPLFPATITCFIGKIDSRSSCRMALPNVTEPGSKSLWSSAMTCGSVGQVSEISWEFLGSEGGTDIYQFTRRFPVDAPMPETVTKQIRFHGKRRIVFEDSYQIVVIEPPTPLDIDYAAITHPAVMPLGWRFQGTSEAGDTRMFDVLYDEPRQEWQLLHTYE